MVETRKLGRESFIKVVHTIIRALPLETSSTFQRPHHLRDRISTYEFGRTQTFRQKQILYRWIWLDLEFQVEEKYELKREVMSKQAVGEFSILLFYFILFIDF